MISAREPRVSGPTVCTCSLFGAPRASEALEALQSPRLARLAAAIENGRLRCRLQMKLGPGVQFGPYEIIGVLGEGGMGTVYRAHDANLNRDVAIKALLPAVANDPERLARFSREAQVLARLNHALI